MRKLVVRPEAEADIDVAAAFYVTEEDVELGFRFCDRYPQISSRSSRPSSRSAGVLIGKNRDDFPVRLTLR